MKTILITLTAALGLSGCGVFDQIAATRAHNYGVITHISKHVNATKSFNEVNTGFGIGSEAPLVMSRWSVGVEAGRFRNSNDELSTYAAGFAEYGLSRNSDRSVRIGAFTGLAEYPAEAAKNRANDELAIGDFIPVVGLQATVPTFGPHEFRFRLTPGLTRADAIITLQSNFVF